MTVTTINLYGIELRVYGNYTAPEQQTYDYIGSPSEFEITEVHHENEDIMDLLEAHEEKIKELCIEYIEE